MLLLHDRLEWFNVGIGIDGERIRHSRRKGHDTIELDATLEDHHGSGALGFVSLEEVLHIAQVVRDPEPLRVRQGFDERLFRLERLMPETAEDAEEHRAVGSDKPLGRKIQVEGDDRSVIGLPGDTP